MDSGVQVEEALVAEALAGSAAAVILAAAAPAAVGRIRDGLTEPRQTAIRSQCPRVLLLHQELIEPWQLRTSAISLTPRFSEVITNGHLTSYRFNGFFARTR